MRGKENLRRLFSMVLAFVMLFTLMPNTALAADDNIRTITLSTNISLANAKFTLELYNIKGNLVNPVSNEGGTVTWQLDSTNISGLTVILNDYNKTDYTFTGFTVNGKALTNPLDGYDTYNEAINELSVLSPNDPDPSPVIPEPGWDIVAVFEEKPLDPADATYKVSADTEDIAKGAVTCEYRGKQDSADKWRISATASDNMQFDYWALAGSDSKFTESLLDIEATENRHYIAHFKPVEIIPSNILSINKLDSLYKSDIICDGKPYGFNNKFYGTSGIINIPFSISSAISSNAATIKVDLHGGNSTDAESLASQTFETEDLSTGEHYFKMLAKSIPSGLDSLTVSVKLTDKYGERQAVTKTYDLNGMVGKYETNQSWTFIPSPDSESEGAARRDICVADPGPFINGAAAFLNPQNGETELFLCGPTGVFVWNADKTAVVRTDITSLQMTAGDGSSKGILAIDGTDAGHMVALVQSDKQTDGTDGGGYYICTYDGTAWKLLENSQFGDVNSNNFVSYNSVIEAHNPKEALIFSESNIWLPKKHWDGSAWNSNDVEYNSFYQADAASGYAGTRTSGLYQYKNSAWTRILSDAFNKRADILSGTIDGKMLVKTAENFADNTYLVNLDTQTVSKVAIPEGISANEIKNVQLTSDGSVCLILNNCQYAGGTFSGSLILKQENDNWVMQDIPAFRAEGDKPYTISGKIRPDGANIILNPITGISIAAGAQGGGGPGSLYLIDKNSNAVTTLTFDGNGGTVRGNTTITGKVNTLIDTDKVPTAAKDGCYFAGWYYDKACTQEWKESGAVMPESNLTLYAKLVLKGTTPDADELSYHREKSIENLKKQFAKYKESNYSAANWSLLKAAYDDGVQKIKSAKPADGDYPENNIIAELNAALKAMADVTPAKVGTVKVAVSVDANTLGLGYIIKPTLVSCDEMARASQVITDLLSANGYKWKNTGSIENGFYLAQVYNVDQTKMKIAQYILNKCGESAISYGDKNDNMLGEFDYYPQSGWMYSMGDNVNKEYPKFPGVGSTDWHLTDGEVMRWQFTVYGLGSDLNADNSTWGSRSIVPNLGNKNQLTWAVAELRDKYSDEVLEANADYNAVIKVLTDPEATQSQIDKANKTLRNAKFDGAVKPNDGKGGSNGKETSTVIAPKATVNSKGEASVELSAKAVKDVLEQVKKDNANVLLIAPEGIDKSSKVSVKLSHESMTDLSGVSGMAVRVQTAVGTVTLPAAAVSEMSKKSGNNFIISVEAKTDNTVSIAVSLDEKRVDTLSGGIKAAIPVKSGDVVVLVNSDGSERILKKSVVDGTTAYALLNGSATVKIINGGKPFGDVRDNDWFKSAVGFASGHELFMGTSETSFSPNASMDRGMLATVLYRLEEASSPGSTAFGDIEAGQYYTEAVNWASKQGIVNGVSESSFAPKQKISREQLATMLFRYAKAVGADTTGSGDIKKFSDASKISPFAQDAMKWAVGSGIMSGKSGTALDPNGSASRAEVAAVLQRFVLNLVK